ncbi:hypothetical protein XENOCAPTIV_008364 [Xenoophorus captivus]|uniref:Uncharacterized protein n=1 Tax=Xenoophorus captivus TaxID=1517983 RepID=A0ABV0RSJ8_9TELE
MTAAALIGEQLILEEDYDENYIPSEQGTEFIFGAISVPAVHFGSSERSRRPWARPSLWPYLGLDSLKGRHIHLSAKADSRSQASEEGAGATTPESEHLAEGSEQEVERELNQLGEGTDVQTGEGDGGKGGVKKTEEEEAGNKTNDGTKREKQGDLSQEEEKEEVNEYQSRSKDRECEEEEGFCVGQDEGQDVSEGLSHSSGQKSSEENEKKRNELKRYVDQNDESSEAENNEGNENKEEKDVEEPEIKDEVAEECLVSHDNGSGAEKMGISDGKLGVTERNIICESQGESKKDAEEKNHKGGQEEEEDEEGESDEALLGCSISHRKLTETPEEVLERFVQSEGKETWKEGVEIEEDSEGQAPTGASESEEEVEVFKAEPSEAQPAGLGQKTLSSRPAEVGFSVLLQSLPAGACSSPSPPPVP